MYNRIYAVLEHCATDGALITPELQEEAKILMGELNKEMNEQNKDHLPRLLLKLLKKIARQERQHHVYVNPHFLVILQNALYDFYNLEDPEVDSYVRDMYET